MKTNAVFKKGLPLIKNNPLFFLLSILSDLAFLFVYGIVVVGLSNKTAEKVLLFGMAAAEKSPALYGGTFNLLTDPELKLLANDILLFAFLTALGFYLVYSLFYGLSWHFSHSIVKPRKFIRYMHNFFIANLLWVPLIGIYKAVEFVNIYAAYFKEPILIYVSNAILLLLLIGWVYLTTICYAILPSIRKTFTIAKQKKTAVPILTIFLGIAILSGLLWLISNYEIAFMIVGICTVFPLLCFMRVVAIVVEK